MADTFQTVDGKSYIYSGKSRSGKSEKCRRDVRGLKFQTVFVFDIEKQWCKLQGYQKITDIQVLKKIVLTGRKGKYAFVPKVDEMREQFAEFCTCVFFWGEAYGSSPDFQCACVAEELAEVTNAQKANSEWGSIVRRGLKRGIWIFALSTRWSEADKSCLGNASFFVVFMAGTLNDAKYIAGQTRIPLPRINQLNKLEYLIYDTDNFAITGGKLTF